MSTLHPLSVLFEIAGRLFSSRQDGGERRRMPSHSCAEATHRFSVATFGRFFVGRASPGIDL
jgi:hypothetical protein